MKPFFPRFTAFPTAVALAAASVAAWLTLAPHSHGAPTAVPACATDLENQLEALDVPGLSAAIVKHGKIVCASAAGMANIEENRPVTPDTLFLVASISKTITATAIMQLVEQGKIDLDDHVGDYLPFEVSVPFSPEASVTLRQLLTHTASIDDNPAYVNCPGWCKYGSEISPFVTRGADSPISLADLTKGYFSPDGAYYDWSANFENAEPGTKTDYSNMGIVLAGYLVEAITGVSFGQYCRDNILTPLGMEKTSWRLARIDPAILAMPYDKNESGFVPYGHYGEPDYPDGMLRTSAIELAHFLIAYMDGGAYGDQRILEPETVQEMLSSQTELEPAQGLVWVKGTIGKRAVWGHDGADNGASANMWFDPEEGEGVILMSNGVWNDDEELLDLLFQEADEY